MPSTTARSSASPTEENTDTTENAGPMSRRSMLCALTVALIVPGGVAACATGDSTTGTGSGTGDTGATTGTGSSAGGSLVALVDVPDGGGIVVDGAGGKKLVLTRSGNTVRAYDASCTHSGTTVAAPVRGMITCPNHGSQFNATDGSVKKGPAAKGLAEVKVKVQGDSVVLA